MGECMRRVSGRGLIRVPQGTLNNCPSFPPYFFFYCFTRPIRHDWWNYFRLFCFFVFNYFFFFFSILSSPLLTYQLSSASSPNPWMVHTAWIRHRAPPPQFFRRGRFYARRKGAAGIFCFAATRCAAIRSPSIVMAHNWRYLLHGPSPESALDANANMSSRAVVMTIIIKTDLIADTSSSGRE